MSSGEWASSQGVCILEGGAKHQNLNSPNDSNARQGWELLASDPERMNVSASVLHGLPSTPASPQPLGQALAQDVWSPSSFCTEEYKDSTCHYDTNQGRFTSWLWWARLHLTLGLVDVTSSMTVGTFLFSYSLTPSWLQSQWGSFPNHKDIFCQNIIPLPRLLHTQITGMFR